MTVFYLVETSKQQCQDFQEKFWVDLSACLVGLYQTRGKTNQYMLKKSSLWSVVFFYFETILVIKTKYPLGSIELRRNLIKTSHLWIYLSGAGTSSLVVLQNYHHFRNKHFSLSLQLKFKVASSFPPFIRSTSYEILIWYAP